MSFALSELEGRLSNLIQQKEVAVQNFHQILGAVAIVEDLIKKFKENEDGRKMDTEGNPEIS